MDLDGILADGQLATASISDAAPAEGVDDDRGLDRVASTRGGALYHADIMRAEVWVGPYHARPKVWAWHII